MLALPADPTQALVISQVVLAVGLPFALVPLLHLTADRGLMGPHVNRRPTTAAGVLLTTVVTVLAAAVVLA